MANLGFAGPVPGVTALSTAADWEDYFRPNFGSGVMTGLAPSLNSGTRSAVMGSGTAFLRAYLARADSSNSTAIPAASGQNRIDRLVLRLDRTATTEANWIKPVVITGTPGASPSPPAIQATDDASWDLPIARWTSASSGALSNLIDERVFLLGPAHGINSAGQPPAPSGQGFAVSSDQAWASLDGSTWQSVYSDSGWTSLDINGPNAGQWESGGVCRARVVNQVCHVRFQIERTSGDVLVDDTNGSTPITLPSQFRPANPEVGSLICGAFNPPLELGSVQVNADGTVQIFAVINRITQGTIVTGSATYLLG